jgi:hypothetical protein
VCTEPSGSSKAWFSNAGCGSLRSSYSHECVRSYRGDNVDTHRMAANLSLTARYLVSGRPGVRVFADAGSVSPGP